jgi:hypothetical protein
VHRPVDAPRLAQHPELERSDPVEGDHGHVGQHRVSVARIWQEIEGSRHICHWWQESNERRITAMTEMLTTTALLLALLLGLAALIRYARRDAFAAPGTGHRAADELGPLSFRRRPA